MGLISRVSSRTYRLEISTPLKIMNKYLVIALICLVGLSAANDCSGVTCDSPNKCVGTNYCLCNGNSYRAVYTATTASCENFFKTDGVLGIGLSIVAMVISIAACGLIAENNKKNRNNVE